MLNEYREAHIDRVITAASNLYKEPNSVCKKCHDMKDICCTFCYCPLYEEENCGGNYSILENGIKDCSNCEKPHTKEFVRKFLMKLYNS